MAKPPAKPSKLANPKSPAVRDALTRECPTCHAAPGSLCITTKGQLLPGVRVVHYGRCRWNDA